MHESEPLDIKAPQILALIAFAGCALGVFLPWATVAGINVENGTDSSGIVALPVAVVGAFVVFAGRSVWHAWLGAAVAVVLIAIGVIGVMEVRNGIENLDLDGFESELDGLLSIFDLEPKVGEGLMLVIAGAVVALVTSIAHALSFKARDSA